MLKQAHLVGALDIHVDRTISTPKCEYCSATLHGREPSSSGYWTIENASNFLKFRPGIQIPDNDQSVITCMSDQYHSQPQRIQRFETYHN